MQTREEVTWLYRAILGRDPESEVAVEHHMASNATLKETRQSFFESQEFASAHHPVARTSALAQSGRLAVRRLEADDIALNTAGMSDVDEVWSDVDALLAVADGRLADLPESYHVPSSDEARAFLAELGLQRLYEISDEILCGQHTSLLPTVIALLHEASREASSRGQSRAVRASVERIHAHQPDDAAISIWLASTLDHVGDAERVVALFEPIVPQLCKYPDSYAPYFRILTAAALQARRIDIISAVADYRPKRTAHHEAAVDAATRRSVDLIAAGMKAASLAEINVDMAEAMSTLDEHGLLQKIGLVSQSADDAAVAPVVASQALVLASIARNQGWSRAYRASLMLAARLLQQETYESTCKEWLEVGLPEEGHQAFLLIALQLPGTSTDGSITTRLTDDQRNAFFGRLCLQKLDRPALADALQAFADTPTLAAARHTWSVAYLTAHHAEVARYAPSGGEGQSIAARARAVVHAPPKRGNETPLWILMPWLKGSDRILRVLSAYVQQATVVLSIGGDGAPKDLRRAGALLLVEGVHILARPVVSWGAQHGGFHNFLEVMEAFRTNAPKEAWFQTVCDRTYPICNLQRFRQWTGDTRQSPLTFGFGPPAWKQEWPDEVVANLADRYHSAIDEVFRAGRSTEFAELATKSRIYGDNDNRLYPTIFNFTEEAQSVDPNSWHRYMISPLEIDTRWMSFARLQCMVDVSNESRTTYTRRHHPMVTRWVQDVFTKYDLRTGSNWAYMSQHYVTSVLLHPDLPEMFSAMNLGFAPEMNFFDTMGATLKMESDFAHLFHVFPANEALDIETSAACISADRDEFFFVRKTNPVEGAELIRFFADRIFEDDSCQALCWVVPQGVARDPVGDPRPVLDQHLLARLSGCGVLIRDLFGRVEVRGRFLASGEILDSDDAELARWSFDGGTLTVTYARPQWGTKTYGKIGGSARSLTFAPLELVGIGNGWSAFLEFDLEDVVSDPDVKYLAKRPSMTTFQAPVTWVGAGNADAALLSSFSDAAVALNFPTPTIEVQGVIHEVRDTGSRMLALASLDTFPTLLRVTGFSQAEGRSMLELERADELDASIWDGARVEPISSLELKPSDLVGGWTVKTLYETQDVRLLENQWITDEDATVVGRWVIRPDGLQILGLSGVIIGLADHVRHSQGIWRLSGWGWRNMKDSVTFSLVQRLGT